jgi:hypothetical protein
MHLPADVRTFLRQADGLRDRRRRINPLTAHECVQQSMELRGIPLVAELGLIVLDDAGDSNPYCLIGKGPAAGMVVHFRHDDAPVISFGSLEAFLAALRTARQRQLDITRIPVERQLRHPNQDRLADYLTSLFERDDDEAPVLVGMHLPLLDPERVGVVRLAASHDDFFVRESAAEFVARHPSGENRRIAEALARDPYPQVADVARRVLAGGRGDDRPE